MSEAAATGRPTPLLLSHRGNMPGFVENTLGGFTAALASGADILESDVHVSRDGVAMLFHDESLERLTGDHRRVRDVSSDELRALDLGAGEGVPSLEEVLVALPSARFNLDMKSPDAPHATASVITRLNAHDRVLLASFSGKNRRKVHRLMPEVATSVSAGQFVAIVFAAKLGLAGLMKRLAGRATAMQIPTRALGMDTATARFIALAQRCGVRVEYWVINDEANMRLLLKRGADGLVTDSVALAREVIASRHTES
ncbi:MAG: glycerophosphodiester phosphodiesterase [Aurantimicrobium sp.]|nr:glycerophosphodiester phosphodiesterase [Aurantimicrobium sp.]